MSNSARNLGLAAIYGATIFVSAFLLFQVQPLVSKAILPWFGGTPAVWTTCMLFFQAALFAGYAYAHISQTRLRPRQQALLHLGVLVIAVMLLRVLPGEEWMPTGDRPPVGEILSILAATIGLPFFVLATTGPLVQAWFAASFPAGTPYRLYALSNLGSLAALLSYPLYFERTFSVNLQARIWGIGYVAFVLLCGYVAFRLWRTAHGNGELKAEHGSAPTGNAPMDAAANESPFRLAAWLLLPAFASLTLLATTNYVCTDIAVVPFLWIIPLSLYLVTFIIAFDRPIWYRPVAMSLLTLVAIFAVGVLRENGMEKISLDKCGLIGRSLQSMLNAALALLPGESPSASVNLRVDFIDFLVVNFTAMFGICLLCHGELYRLRPHPSRLTLYYLLIAAGGALGGAAVTILAPQVFSTYFEWDIAVFGGCLLAILLIVRGLVDAVVREPSRRLSHRMALFVPLAGLVLVPAGVALVDLRFFLKRNDSGVHFRFRNFFGALTIRGRDVGSPDGQILTLLHGAIAHGSQFVATHRRGQPTTYYATPTGVGQTFKFYRNAPRNGGLRIGAVGLGTGTLAAYALNGDTISFYEINPAVVAIAESGYWFTYLEDCRKRGAEYDIQLGDARLTLQRELKAGAPQRYHILVLDAFSGDAIPMHLLTEEAFAAYVQHVAPPEPGDQAGAIAVHTSNRYVDLVPVVRALARRYGLTGVRVHNNDIEAQNIEGSEWIILTNNRDLLRALNRDPDQPDDPTKPGILWTDQRSNLFDVLKKPRSN
jgi:hypothetical protein